MTPSAIHQAIRLSKYPNEMSWLCQSNALLPDGVTELLRLASSTNKIKLFADKYHTDEEQLQKILLKFIDVVLLNESNSNEKVLGVDEQVDFDLYKTHYQLLIKIYHPDKNTSPDAAYQTARITKAYHAVKNMKPTSEYKNIQISRVHPNSFNHATLKAEQEISNVKSAFIAVAVITFLSAVWLGGYIYEPASPELFSKASNDSDPTLFFNADQSNQFTMAKSANVDETQSEQFKFQALLSSIETAYEDGNARKIQTILNSPEIKEQSDKEVLAKLKNLFEITSERKMLLYDFEWKNLSGEISGKGKFLSRYQLKGDNQWLIREGVASIIASQSDKSLNITSLKLDNKNIDQ
jgi:curved DNA-binding protein CbpA